MDIETLNKNSVTKFDHVATYIIVGYVDLV